MKVLLIQDVYKLGHAGDVKVVADGYGRNYLLPRGLAVLATPSALRRAERIRQAAAERRAREQADIEAMAQVLNGARFVFHARAGEKGKLYGSVTAAQIAEAISERLGSEFDRRKVALREPIREVGTYHVQLRLSADVTPEIVVTVLPEGAADTAAAGQLAGPSVKAAEPGG